MNESCGCCEGPDIITPISTANRPGLDALVYRVGTHATFLETMKARLSSREFQSLANLRTRDANDPAIALLDAWATVADVLTFYQERIANEGYLWTATERRSVLELARLVGYTLRPGVAATVYPAFTMEIGYSKGSQIPQGTRVQSLPGGQGEMPQFFETAETIEARTEWNNLQPRLTQPHHITTENAKKIEKLYLQGITTNLKSNDPLLLVFGATKGKQIFRQVQAITPGAVENRTLVELQVKSSTPRSTTAGEEPDTRSAFERLGDSTLLKGLAEPPSLPPANALRLGLTPQESYQTGSDLAAQLLTTLKPELEDTLYAAWANAEIIKTPPPLESIQALRIKAAPFGANAPLKPTYDDSGRLQGYEEWAIAGTATRGVTLITNRAGTPEQVVVSLRQGIDTINRSESLFENENPRLPIDFSLDGQNIHITYVRDEIGELIFRHTVTVVFLTQTIIFTSESNNQWRVQVGSIPRSIALGEFLQYSGTEGEKVRISYLGQTSFLSAVGRQAVLSLSVLVESAVSVPNPNVLALDGQYDQILPESWVVIERPDPKDPSGKTRKSLQVIQTATIAKTDYGLSAKVTQLTLNDSWLEHNDDKMLDKLRKITVYAQSEKLKQAEEVVDENITGLEADGKTTKEIELGALYDGLKPGRWLIVSGERADLGATSGVRASELVMLLGVRQDVAKIGKLDLPGDKTHTFLKFAEPLKYQYKRDTVTIYGNVLKATHGETRPEVLGSGNGSQVFQQFPVRQIPLTYLAAPTSAGAASTLELRVNDILWHEQDSLADLKPSDRAYIIKIGDDGNTSVIFGNGESGSRLPSGVENVRAVYRSGIGNPGNVKAEQISLLATRPLGLKSVINPLPATGGADRENRDQARKNASLAVMSLERLVSVQDYADFARTFVGIGKASARDLSDGRRRAVHLTIAGADDIPIAKSSDLYRNLRQALHQLGDPNQAIQVDTRELMLLLISGSVKVLPDYQWESVEPKIRQALLNTFSFGHRDLGEDVTLSEVISTIQQVPGVDYADVDILDSISETEAENPTLLVNKLKEALSQTGEQPKSRITVNFARPEPTKQLIQPAQLALLTSKIPLTLNLNPLNPVEVLL
jgi:predicted phage baseplate assembly protein